MRLTSESSRTWSSWNPSQGNTSSSQGEDTQNFFPNFVWQAYRRVAGKRKGAMQIEGFLGILISKTSKTVFNSSVTAHGG